MKVYKDITIQIELSCDDYDTPNEKLNKTVQELVNDINRTVNRRIKKARQMGVINRSRDVRIEHMSIKTFPKG